MDNFLRRRGSFWDNWRHGIEEALNDISARSAEKWVDEEDKNGINGIKELLRGALLIAMRRYSEVLNEQIEVMSDEVIL